jgi:hypothetical protein
MGILRALAGLAMAVGMTAAWILLVLVVMAVSLYIARLVPLTGRRKRAPTAATQDRP